MTNLSTFSLTSCKELSEDHKMDNYFDLPCSETDLLKLQESFMTLGLQELETKNIQIGRQIITMILSSLRYHQNIAVITTSRLTDHYAVDILAEIKDDQNVANPIFDLETFLTMNPCLDFIWIEMSDDLQKKYSSQHIKNIFDMYHINQRMTVLMVTYDEK